MKAVNGRDTSHPLGWFVLHHCLRSMESSLHEVAKQTLLSLSNYKYISWQCNAPYQSASLLLWNLLISPNNLMCFSTLVMDRSGFHTKLRPVLHHTVWLLYAKTSKCCQQARFVCTHRYLCTCSEVLETIFSVPTPAHKQTKDPLSTRSCSSVSFYLMISCPTISFSAI